jgi:hypothetical protein
MQSRLRCHQGWSVKILEPVPCMHAWSTAASGPRGTFSMTLRSRPSLRSRPGYADAGPAGSSGTPRQGRQRQHRLRQHGAIFASAAAVASEQLEQWVTDSNQQRLTALEVSHAPGAGLEAVCTAAQGAAPGSVSVLGRFRHPRDMMAHSQCTVSCCRSKPSAC